MNKFKPFNIHEWQAKHLYNINEETLNEEYVESMDHIKLANAMGVIKTQWDEWKAGPMTEPGDIKPAQKELISWISRFLKKNIK